MPSYECPVCSSPLAEPPWDRGSPSDELRRGCGIQFGYNDLREDLRSYIYAEWRNRWEAAGKRAFSGEEWRNISIDIASRAKRRLDGK
jgi:hypothetical protein